MSAVPTITLNDGNAVPQLGFGVFQIDPEDTAQAVGEALEIGYRHIDTAEMYGNEKEVGEAVRASGLDRDEIFVTSKLSNAFHEPDDARVAFDTTLSELGFDYVDLFLIHWPLPTLYDGDFVSTWKTLEEVHRNGRARSIGVSNFQIAHLERLAAETETVPAVNQIEVHPYLTNDAVRARPRSRARNRHTGVVPDRPGRGPGRSHDHPNRLRGRKDAGAGRLAVARPARRHRVPKVGDAVAYEGELRPLRLQARLRRHE